MRSIENRISWHKSQLKSGKHNNPALLSDYKKYGPRNFFYKVEFLTNDENEAATEERNLIDRWESYNFFYNSDADFTEKNAAIAQRHSVTRKTPEWKEMQSALTTEQHRLGKFRRKYGR